MDRKLWGALCALSVTLAGPLLLAAEAESEAGGHGAPKGVIPPTVWGILVFVTVLLILWKKAFPPITEALEKRSRQIQESLDAAEKARKDTEALMARNEEALEKARVEARAIIEEGKTDALKVKDRIVESAKQESKGVTERALREIDLAKQKAMDDIHHRAVELAGEITRKVIRKTLRPEDHVELIQEAVRKFKEAG